MPPDVFADLMSMAGDVFIILALLAVIGMVLYALLRAAWEAFRN